MVNGAKLQKSSKKSSQKVYIVLTDAKLQTRKLKNKKLRISVDLINAETILHEHWKKN